MNQKTIFQKDFILVVIGQIISLFGNTILRFALPLYLLNETKSAALYGVVSACAFIPMIILSPIGGIIADRVNKRNVMVILDFSTALLMILFSILLGKTNLVVLLLITLILLYGIQGAYQPSVQASIPALVSNDDLMSANAVITLVSSLSSLVGPILGGALFAMFGIRPILMIGIICFFLSAVMEIFITIPFQKKESHDKILTIAAKDMRESFHFIAKENPAIGQVTILLALINLFLSSLMMIGIPVIITQSLNFPLEQGNRLLGYAEGSLGLGALIGGILAGTLFKKIKIQSSYLVLILGSLPLISIGLGLCLPLSSGISYIIILISCLVMMTMSSIYNIQIMSYVQYITPAHLIGKVMALAMCICMCMSPLGQAMYGILFEKMGSAISILFFGVFIICTLIALVSKKIMKGLPS